jgi:hypothetical protein
MIASSEEATTAERYAADSRILRAARAITTIALHTTRNTGTVASIALTPRGAPVAGLARRDDEGPRRGKGKEGGEERRPDTAAPGGQEDRKVVEGVSPVQEPFERESQDRDGRNRGDGGAILKEDCLRVFERPRAHQDPRVVPMTTSASDVPGQPPAWGPIGPAFSLRATLQPRRPAGVHVLHLALTPDQKAES